MKLQRRHAVLAAAGLGIAGRLLTNAARTVPLDGQVAVVTGGSRGLGLLIARELASRGCELAHVARDADELERARADLRGRVSGLDPLTVACDVGDQAQVGQAIDAIMTRFGRIDILVNNAGIITVGPLASLTLEDFGEAMAVMYWGMVYGTLAVLEDMRRRGSGRIVNITSIGGKVSVPHLLPYSSAKFAAVGFSEGLRAELAGTGVRVTTVVPGLMRTGSHVNAMFHGDAQREYTLFSLAATLPVVSMDAERAARQVVTAASRGDPEVVLGMPATVLALAHGLAPSLVVDGLGLVARILPHAPSSAATPGWEAERELNSPALTALTTLGRRAALRFGQEPASSAARAPVPIDRPGAQDQNVPL